MGYYDAFLHHINETSDYAEGMDVDVVFIIDSCFSGFAANRTLPVQVPRVVEILAACESDKTALGNKGQQNRTFTAKLADTVAKQKGKGEPLSFAEMMALVDKDSPKIKPFYELFLGPASVRLPFPSNDQVQPTTSTSSQLSLANYRAVFSVHLPGLPTREALKNLVEWIRNLDRSMNITLDGVYNTDSVGLVMEAPFHVFAQLERLPGVKLVFKNTNGNQLGQLTASDEPVAADLSRLSLSPLKENLKGGSK